MVEEVGEVSRSEIGRMLLIVKNYEATHPGDVGCFGANGVVSDTDGVAQLIEEFWRLLGGVGHLGRIGGLALAGIGLGDGV